MAPQTEGTTYPVTTEEQGKFPLTSGVHKYPAMRDISLRNPQLWIKGKREDDAVDPYWRIYDKLYDFSEFVDTHPGGQFWLEETKGTDITELFESSHITLLPETLLKKYYVKDITTPRNSTFTFEKNGFYKTLQRKARPILKKLGTGPTLEMRIIQDTLLLSFFLFGYLTAVYTSYFYAAIAGVLMTAMATAAHNFFHQKDSWRMYIFDLSFMASRDWRISHALSHHIYTNTIYDYEISSLEPNLTFLPKSNKSLLYRYAVYITGIYSFVTGFTNEFISKFRLVLQGKVQYRIPDSFPIIELLLMAYFNGSFLQAFKLWAFMHTFGNTVFLFVGIQAGHHHPNIYHEGDVPPTEKDWGIHQIITTRERGQTFFNGPLLLIAISFGNHTLHHLFPTVDHSKLPYLKDVFFETCKEYGIKFDIYSPWVHLRGAYKRLTSTKGNPNKPDILKNAKFQ